MLWIPTGAFPMGSPSGTGESDERPQHSIYVDAFYIDRVEVTNAQYRACVLAGVCRMPAELDSPTRESYFDEDAFAEYPVIYVSWSDAETYCAWADKRLPTEAEWEKAARGLDGRRYPWGDQPPAPDLAQYGQPDSDTARTGDHPAGASPYGLHDAAGNVWEWVSDWYSPTYYSSSPAVNPTGPGAGARKVLRGGSWDMDDSLLAAANRFKMAPDHRSFNIGFRCAHNK